MPTTYHGCERTRRYESIPGHILVAVGLLAVAAGIFAPTILAIEAVLGLSIGTGTLVLPGAIVATPLLCAPGVGSVGLGTLLILIH